MNTNKVIVLCKQQFHNGIWLKTAKRNLDDLSGAMNHFRDLESRKTSHHREKHFLVRLSPRIM